MTNIINEQQKENKELLNEIKTLKKQLENKEDDFKLRIWNAIDNVKENKSPEIAGTLMTLEQHFWPKDNWVNVQKENGVEKVIFGNQFTLENVVKGFTEWTLTNADSFSFIYDKNKKLEEKNAILEKGNTELKEELEKNKLLVEKWKARAEKAEIDNEIHLEALQTGGKERWTQKEASANEIAEKNQKLEISSKIIENKDARIGELEWELKQEREKVEVSNKIISEKESRNKNLTEENKGLQNQLHLAEKDLPALPKKQSKFRQLRTKLKTEFHQLVENKKCQIQELVARIEVSR